LVGEKLKSMLDIMKVGYEVTDEIRMRERWVGWLRRKME